MTIAENFDAAWLEDPVTGCWIWQRARKGKEAKRGGGYGCLTIKGKRISAHVFSYERAHGPKPRHLHVLHSCHNTKCVNPAHLHLGTNNDNQAEKAAALRAAAKLTPVDVVEIREAVAAGELQRVVAARHNLHQADVSNIVHRKYWKHV